MYYMIILISLSYRLILCIFIQASAIVTILISNQRYGLICIILTFLCKEIITSTVNIKKKQLCSY